MMKKQNIQLNMRMQGIITLAHHDYNKKLNAYAFFKTQDRALSDDLVQATFMKTWKYLVVKGNIITMKTFLYHILNDLIIDEYRKHKTVSLDILREKGFEPRDGYTDRFFDILDGKAATLLIQCLPEKYRKAINMRYVRELTIEEISRINGQSKNTVAVQVHRGLEKLKLLYNLPLSKWSAC